MNTKPKNWKRTLGQRVAHLSATQAHAILDAHRKRGIGIGDPTFRDLTGGYSSQSIDAAVIRKLAERAGIRKRTAARKRAKPNCCRGCDTPWNAKQAEGECRTCKACLACCGRSSVRNSCAARNAARTPARARRSGIAYDAYWRSYEAGRQKR